MISTFRNRPFDFISNKENPLGLFKPSGQDGKVYELLGYYHSLSGKELNSPTFGQLPNSNYTFEMQTIFNKSECIAVHDDQGIRKFLSKAEDRIALQLKHMGLDPNEIFCFNANAGYVILFTIHRQPFL